MIIIGVVAVLAVVALVLGLALGLRSDDDDTPTCRGKYIFPEERKLESMVVVSPTLPALS